MTVESYAPQQWITGSDQIAHVDGVIAAGQNLPERTPLGQKTADGKFYAWDPAATDGTEVAVYLTGHDVDATAGDKTAGLIKAGTFNPDLVNWPAATDAQKATAFVGTPIGLQKLNG